MNLLDLELKRSFMTLVRILISLKPKGFKLLKTILLNFLIVIFKLMVIIDF
jgi:hypothetical protein